MSAPQPSASSSKPEKERYYKGQSRVHKCCHWCTKKEDPNSKPFQACGECKEVIYCSRECQRASWPLHKTTCALNSANRKVIQAARPDMIDVVAQFKKWHPLHTEVFKHAVVCGLNLGKNPKNVDKELLYVEVRRRPDHEALPLKRKFELSAGFKMSFEDAYLMMGPNGKPLLDNCKVNSEFMKKKGGVGVSPLFMEMDGFLDVVNVLLPKPKDALLMQNINDWGEEWFLNLAGALLRTEKDEAREPLFMDVSHLSRDD